MKPWNQFLLSCLLCAIGAWGFGLVFYIIPWTQIQQGIESGFAYINSMVLWTQQHRFSTLSISLSLILFWVGCIFNYNRLNLDQIPNKTFLQRAMERGLFLGFIIFMVGISIFWSWNIGGRHGLSLAVCFYSILFLTLKVKHEIDTNEQHTEKPAQKN